MSTAPAAIDWAAVTEAGKTRPDPIPAGWFTVNQYAQAIGRSNKRASELLRLGIENGRIESRKFYIETRGRSVFPVPHYKIKNGEMK